MKIADVSSVADVGQMMKARGIMSPEKRAELLAALGGAREDVQAAFIEGFKAGLAELDHQKEKRR